MHTDGISAIAGLTFCTILIAGCSTAQLRSPYIAKTPNNGLEDLGCHDIVTSVQRAVADAKTGDAQARRIRGFPYLRINRFLAHVGKRFKNRASGRAFTAWVDRLRALDAEAIRVEVTNLPTGERLRLSKRIFGHIFSRERIIEVVDACAHRRRRIELADPRRARRLVDVAFVPAAYSQVAQAIGLFPLTSIPIGMGWERWKRENLSSFHRPQAALPVRGRIVEFAPAKSRSALNANNVRAIVERNRDPLLGIPEPKGRDLARLFSAFAPIWQIDVTGGYDLIGHPSWETGDAVPVVDNGRPVVFTRVSHTIVDDQVLLQLNYSIWFQERPRDTVSDTLAGNLDGLIWRVTLGPDGRPLIYDSVHACGCYHLLFPLGSLRGRHRKARTHAMREVPAIVNTAPIPSPGHRVVLRFATRTHYLVATSISGPRHANDARRIYRFSDDNVLRSLPLTHGRRRSLFRDDGIVAGTERLERIVLWPSGITSPGAMRQWGHHAIAFLDQRHFDDPKLFETIFFGK